MMDVVDSDAVDAAAAAAAAFLAEHRPDRRQVKRMLALRPLVEEAIARAIAECYQERPATAPEDTDDHAE